MKLSKDKENFINSQIERLYDELKIRLLGRFFKGPRLMFEIVDHEPKNTLEGVFRFATYALYGSSKSADVDLVEKLSRITANYIDAAKHKAMNSIEMSVHESKDVDELIEKINEQLEKETSKINQIVVTETRNASSLAEQSGIVELASDLGITDPTVVKIGRRDGKTCKVCKHLWWHDYEKNIPKAYKMSELQDGYNKSSKPEESTATTLATHPHCFTEKNVPVLTETGWKKISEIKIGEKVLTHKGHFKRVTNTINEPYREKEVVIVRYKYNDRNLKFSVTPDHKFMTQKGWVRADELQSSDKFIRLNIPCSECGNSVTFKDQSFKFRLTCSDKCESEFCRKKAIKQHVEMPDNIKLIRAAKCSTGVKEYNQKNGSKSLFKDPSYWTPERRKWASDSIRSRMKDMLHASASTRVSYNHKLAHGWLLDHYRNENIHTEYNVGRYFIDIAFPDHKLGIEIDGKYHAVPHRKEKDKVRDTELKKAGWTILRFGVGQPKSINKKDVVGGVHTVLSNHNGLYTFEETEIVSIKKGVSGSKTNIYCLTVEDDESFIARGVISHNCRCILTFCPPNFGYDSNGRIVFKYLGFDEWKDQRGVHQEKADWSKKNPKDE